MEKTTMGTEDSVKFEAELGEALAKAKESMKAEDLDTVVARLAQELDTVLSKAPAITMDPTHGGCPECVAYGKAVGKAVEAGEPGWKQTAAAPIMGDMTIHWAKAHPNGNMMKLAKGFGLESMSDDEIRAFTLEQATSNDESERQYEQFKVASEALEHAIDVYEADKTEENFEAMCRASDEYGAAITPSSAALERNIGEF